MTARGLGFLACQWPPGLAGQGQGVMWGRFLRTLVSLLHGAGIMMPLAVAQSETRAEARDRPPGGRLQSVSVEPPPSARSVPASPCAQPAWGSMHGAAGLSLGGPIPRPARPDQWARQTALSERTVTLQAPNASSWQVQCGLRMARTERCLAWDRPAAGARTARDPHAQPGRRGCL